MSKCTATDTAQPAAETLLNDHQLRQLDPAQRTRLRRVTHEATLLYPDRPDLQRAAAEAAIDYLCGDADLAAEGAEWHRIRREEQRLGARVRQLAVLSVADKIFSERCIARMIAVDRMALRRWSGKTTAAGAAPRRGARR
ncbi:MAG: hypothetical protein PHQ28_00790 [Mycobacterium sp.]|nr:hypothetical protein [Mycobacterium sp.]